MTVIRLTREFSFEMAHALAGYDGACSRVHGHSYRLFVTVRGVPSTTASDPKEGMVLDFTILKEIVNNLIINKLDHQFLVREVVGAGGAGMEAASVSVGAGNAGTAAGAACDTAGAEAAGFAGADTGKAGFAGTCGNPHHTNAVGADAAAGRVVVDFQPTCENLVAWMAGVLSTALPQGVELFSLKLHETARSFAEWHAKDNGQ